MKIPRPTLAQLKKWGGVDLANKVVASVESRGKNAAEALIKKVVAAVAALMKEMPTSPPVDTTVYTDMILQKWWLRRPLRRAHFQNQ